MPRLRLLVLTGLGAALSCGRVEPVFEPVPMPGPAEIHWTLLLAGDAGAPRDDDPVLAALTAAAGERPDRTTILFLGDNIYPRGLPDSLDPERAEMERRLSRQVETATRSGAHAIFVPGNHDWDKHSPEGWAAIRRQAEAVRRMGGGLAELLPEGGCPGPAVRDVGDRFRLVLVDTQWWLHGGPKPDAADCLATPDRTITDSLGGALAGAGTRHVVVAAHHPLRSGGKHGGRFGLMDHLFPLRELKSWLWVPLPVIGSAYPIARASGISSQDVSGSKNREMRRALEEAMRDRPPLVYASGHEHNLQVIAGSSARWLLVSGTGFVDHAGAAHRLDSTRYAARASGFMRLDATEDGRVRLGVIVVDGSGAAREAWATWLE